MSTIGSALLTRPGWSYGIISALLAAAALSPTPAPLPLIALVGVLRLASRQLVHRVSGISQLYIILFAVALGGSARHLAPALSATSSTFTSLLSLLILNLASGAFAFIVIGFDAHFSSRIRNTGSQTLFFPALWASGWALASQSPVGRLFAWSPVAQDMGPFTYLAPYFGPWGFDWIIASGAVVFSELTGTMLMGTPMVLEEDDIQCTEDLLISTDPIDDHIATTRAVQDRVSQRAAATGRTVRYSAPFRRPMWFLSALLVLLALPSYLVDTSPLSPISAENLSVTVGCVLPGPIDGHPPDLGRYINESKTLVESKILIWPEGAVLFKSQKDRENQLAIIRKDVFKGKQNAWIGISFEESLPLTTSDGRYKTRNGFLLMSSNNETTTIVHEYYKRNLVPVAESFKMVAGSIPPNLTTVDIREKMTRYRWRTSPLTLTAGICMDFASAAPFSDLAERPGLVLAPARTWHPAAGSAMWAQAQARAAEIGVPALLWCDGGEGGLSGIAGAAVGPHGRLMRAGSGSWQTQLTIPRSTEQPTMYARWGNWGMLGLVWAIVGLGAVADSGRSLVGLRGSGSRGDRAWVPRQLGWVVQYLQDKRRAAVRRLRGERTPLLIDA